MIPLVWDATNDKPMGQSRLKEPIRRLIQGYVRTVANATIGLEFATSPQKYLLGITDEQYDALVDQKFRQYVGSILLSTSNPDTGQNPVYGQLNQGNIEPHIQMLRMLATQFSAATGLTVTDTGVINDANPTSSDAILAQSQTLVAMAQQLNNGNADALYQISQMALAIELGTTPDGLSDDDKDIVAHFKNPAMPSVAVTADAAIKIASAREGFSKTDTFLEMIGFDQADIRRIKAQEQRARGFN
ncbi:MAG: phage portal protein, partial [Dorea sp.]|nr:phage portal protein [Dorea sp.]